MGCIVDVDLDDSDNILNVEGNSCKHGEVYAISEIKNPCRMVCSTVRVENGKHEVVSVKTESPIPKGLIFNIMDEINNVKLQAPVKIGQVVIENVCNTNINIIATSEMRCKGY